MPRGHPPTLSRRQWNNEVVSTGRRDGQLFHNMYLFITALRSRPTALLHQAQQCWPRDTSATDRSVDGYAGCLTRSKESWR
jgi:hypothetical protein